jgi:hypothetical protein
MATTSPTTNSKTDSLLAGTVTRAEAAADAANSVGATGLTFGRSVRSWLSRLSGVSGEFSTEATLWLARPLMWLVLLLGLVALGLKTLYVDNPVFGASPFTDALGLIFWGLSADVASRTLSSLRLTDANRPGGR